MHVNSCNHHPDRDTEHSHLFVPPSLIFYIGNTLCFILKCIFGPLQITNCSQLLYFQLQDKFLASRRRYHPAMSQQFGDTQTNDSLIH